MMTNLEVTTLTDGRAKIDGQAVDDLQRAMRGPVLTTASPGYDEARQVWNKLIDKRPALIVRATGTADVVTAVNFVRRHNILLAIHGAHDSVKSNRQMIELEVAPCQLKRHRKKSSSTNCLTMC